MIASAAPVPGGQPTSRAVAVGDSNLVINSVSQQPGSKSSSTVLTVDLSLQNNGNQAITSQSESFELIGVDGDTFLSLDTGRAFDAEVAGHTTHRGVVEFEVPKAATSGLNLMYRPGPTARTVMVPLKVT